LDAVGWCFAVLPVEDAFTGADRLEGVRVA